MLTHEQIDLVQRSFARVLPVREDAADLFYARLFAIDPSAKPLFRGDLKLQGAKLMASLGIVVNALDQLDTIADTVTGLARRHVLYGVEEAHYDRVGEALLWTLERLLGTAFTDPVRDAWATAYAVLSRTMIAAARQPDPA